MKRAITNKAAIKKLIEEYYLCEAQLSEKLSEYNKLSKIDEQNEKHVQLFHDIRLLEDYIKSLNNIL